MPLVTKAFEIRDSGTFIPVIATAMVSDVPEEAYLLSRAGYQNFDYPTCVMVTRLHDCKSSNDAHAWPNRTMFHAHMHIETCFQELQTGDVIDVEFLLGERSTPKISERLG